MGELTVVVESMTGALTSAGSVIMGAATLELALEKADAYVREVQWDTRDDVKAVKVEVWALCGRCEGTGYLKAGKRRSLTRRCPKCDGGVAVTLYKEFVKCENLDGTGKVPYAKPVAKAAT